MKIQIFKDAYNRIFYYYINVSKRWKHTWSLEDSFNYIDNVKLEFYKVRTELTKVNPNTTNIIDAWKDYNINYSKITKWYFAYLTEGILFMFLMLNMLII